MGDLGFGLLSFAHPLYLGITPSGAPLTHSDFNTSALPTFPEEGVCAVTLLGVCTPNIRFGVTHLDYENDSLKPRDVLIIQ